MPFVAAQTRAVPASMSWMGRLATWVALAPGQGCWLGYIHVALALQLQLSARGIHAFNIEICEGQSSAGDDFIPCPWDGHARWGV